MISYVLIYVPDPVWFPAHCYLWSLDNQRDGNTLSWILPVLLVTRRK